MSSPPYTTALLSALQSTIRQFEVSTQTNTIAEIQKALIAAQGILSTLEVIFGIPNPCSPPTQLPTSGTPPNISMALQQINNSLKQIEGLVQTAKSSPEVQSSPSLQSTLNTILAGIGALAPIILELIK